MPLRYSRTYCRISPRSNLSPLLCATSIAPAAYVPAWRISAFVASTPRRPIISRSPWIFPFLFNSCRISSLSRSTAKFVWETTRTLFPSRPASIDEEAADLSASGLSRTTPFASRISKALSTWPLSDNATASLCQSVFWRWIVSRSAASSAVLAPAKRSIAISASEAATAPC